ncbi:MAG: hypothetical protein ABI411_17350 [Tahibacter sp.]
MRAMLSLMLLSITGISPATETSVTPPTPQIVPLQAPADVCKPAEFHQFDFWIGDWEVFDPSGAQVGKSRIEPILNGCAISENWTESTGSEGKSYNAWEPSDKRWHQFWVSDNGSTLWLTGGLVGKSMVLSGAKTDPKSGVAQAQRITWTPNADGSVRQHWEVSDDAGKTWSSSFDGTYRKAK